MGIDFCASFAPVPVDRGELLDPVLILLHRMEAQVNRALDRLTLESEKLVYRDDPYSCDSVAEAFELASTWDGFELHFTYKYRLCTLMVWNDLPHQTTVVLTEPKPLFTQQQDEPAERRKWFALLADALPLVESEFCVLETGSEYRSRTRDDFLAVLKGMPGSKPPDWNGFLAMVRTIPASLLPPLMVESPEFCLFPDSKSWAYSWMGAIRPSNPG